MKKIKLLYLLAIFAIGFTACQKDNSTDPDIHGNNNVDNNGISEPSQFKILLTDAPIDLDEVNIDIQRVIVRGTDSRDSIDIGANAGVYNLLDFQNGVTTLIGASTLTVDTITGIRIILGENNTVVKDGETHDLRTPSAQQSGLKLKVCIPLVDVVDYDLTLDFDACKSVFQTGNGKYVLKPRIKILNADAVCKGDDDADGDDDEEEEEDDDDEDEEEDDEEDDDDEEEDDDISLDNVPTPVLDYLAANYPDALIEEVNIQELCDEVSYYVVEVETMDDGDMLLVFDMDGNFVDTASQIHNDDLPMAVLDGVDTAYPNKKIKGNYSWQIGDQYILKLKGNTRVVVDADGNVLCEL